MSAKDKPEEAANGMSDEKLIACLRGIFSTPRDQIDSNTLASVARVAANRLEALTRNPDGVTDQMEVVAASIWHCMDEKTQAEYGPWVRAADHQAALDATKCGDSPYPWKDTRFVPGTSKVSPGVMLMDGQGACIGFVSIMNAEPETHVEVARALSTAGDIARTRRHLQAARKGEEENGLRAEAAEARIAVLEKALEECEPYVEILHSLMMKKDTRRQVMAVLRRARAALNGGAEK